MCHRGSPVDQGGSQGNMMGHAGVGGQGGLFFRYASRMKETDLLSKPWGRCKHLCSIKLYMASFHDPYLDLSLNLFALVAARTA